MTVKTYIRLLLTSLVLAFFFERYCFIVVVYKTKNFDYTLILFVIFFNTLFLYVIHKLRQAKHTKRLFEIYDSGEEPKVHPLAMTLIAVIDMLKSLFLFWPANSMPIWLFLSLLQLFIPLNMLFRSCCISGIRHSRIHQISSAIIFVGCIINSLTLLDNSGNSVGEDFRKNSLMLIISTFLDVISHTIKEALVRSQPLNQEKFNFRLSLF